LRHRTGWRRHVRRTELQRGNGGFGRRHYPGADKVLSDGGSVQHEEQDARSHTVIICREVGEPFTKLRPTRL
jgi:hypothetical protein